MTVRKMLLIMFMIVSAVFVFANGQGEGAGEKFENRHDELQTLIDSKEKVTLTGELLIANRLLPELKVGSDVYKLKVPRYCVAAVDVSDGAEITVTGVILKVKAGVNTRMFKAGESVFVVEKAVINGEEYDLQELIQDHDGEFRGCNGKGRGSRGHGMGFPHGGQFGRGMHPPLDEIFE